MVIAATIAVGLAVFVIVGALAYRAELRDFEAVLGAALTGMLVSLAVGDLLIEDLRQWWTARPMFAAAVGGAVLLGLTVVLIDKAVERSRARQWRRILAQPVSYLLLTVGGGEISQARLAIEKVPWQGARERGQDPPWTHRSETEEALQALDTAAASVKAAVDQIRPELLMAAADSARTYRSALDVTSATQRSMSAVAEFREKVTEGDGMLFRSGPPYGDYEDRAKYVTWLWEGVQGAYDGLAKALQALETAAHADFSSELPKEGLRFAIPTLDEDRVKQPIVGSKRRET